MEELIDEEDHADSYMWELVKETTSDGDAWKLKCVVGGHWLNIAYRSDQPGAEAKVWNDPDTHAYRLWTPERVPSTASGVELPMTFSDPQEFQCLDLLPLRGGEHRPASRTARAGQLPVFMPIPGRLAGWLRRASPSPPRTSPSGTTRSRSWPVSATPSPPPKKSSQLGKFASACESRLSGTSWLDRDARLAAWTWGVSHGGKRTQ
ncbi:hypothetical protein GZL_00585 [Streptomyces sp. 769]|nr:hypothetical protein GZL_00585 [Streptomyces sp. 769]